MCNSLLEKYFGLAPYDYYMHDSFKHDFVENSSVKGNVHILLNRNALTAQDCITAYR